MTVGSYRDTDSGRMAVGAAAVPASAASAAGLLALLGEESDALKAHALKNLLLVVDNHWVSPPFRQPSRGIASGGPRPSSIRRSEP